MGDRKVKRKKSSMPMYEYKCTDCDFTFDELRKKAEEREFAECPKCKSIAKKLLSAQVSFDFKNGMGTYKKGLDSWKK